MNKSLLKENRVHGTPLYPVSVYEVKCPAGEPLLELHWHDELELLMVTEGRALFRVDAGDYELQAGEAVFVNSGELHGGVLSGDGGCSFRAVVFHADVLGGGQPDLVQERYIRPLLQKKRVAPVHITPQTAEGRDIAAMLAQLFELNRAAAPLYELTTKGLLLLIVAKLLQLGGPAVREPLPATERIKIERLKTLIDYMQANFAKPLKLQELARHAAISEAYLCRFFKEFTRQSPLSYVNRIRVQKAADLLRNTDAKIMDIALDVGFESLSYFAVVFKQRFGCTPSAYRKRNE